jgi:hypothetical protein
VPLGARIALIGIEATIHSDDFIDPTTEEDRHYIGRKGRIYRGIKEGKMGKLLQVSR